MTGRLMLLVGHDPAAGISRPRMRPHKALQAGKPQGRIDCRHRSGALAASKPQAAAGA